MTFDARLREMIGKIEHSHLSQSEKSDVYMSIRAGLHVAVWPVLIVHMPEVALSRFTTNTQHVTLETYTALISSTIQDSRTLDDLESLMHATLTGVEKVLKEKFIIQT